MTMFYYNDNISIPLHEAHLVGCTECAAKAPRDGRGGPGAVCLRRLHSEPGTLSTTPAIHKHKEPLIPLRGLTWRFHQHLQRNNDHVSSMKKGCRTETVRKGICIEARKPCFPKFPGSSHPWNLCALSY